MHMSCNVLFPRNLVNANTYLKIVISTIFSCSVIKQTETTVSDILLLTVVEAKVSHHRGHKMMFSQASPPV